MSHVTELTERHSAELRRIAEDLPDRFTEAAIAVEARLGLAALSRWAEIAAGLVDRTPRAAISFIEATPAALAHLEPEELEAWASQGRRLYRGSWKSAKLAARFFRISPVLLESLSLPALARIADIVGRLAQSSDEMASACLDDSPSLLASLDQNDREPFLAFTQAVCEASRIDAHRCFERAPDLLAAVQPDQRTAFLELAAVAAREAGGDGFSLFAASAEALGALDRKHQAEVVELAQRLTPHSARAAMESIASAPEVRRRLTSSQARRWSEAGLELLSQGQPPDTAESYFRIESAGAEAMLSELSTRVELSDVGAVLRLYAKALSGEPLLVQSTEALVGRNIGWAAGAATTTDGISVFLPPEVDLMGDRDANFQVYKVHATHQVGRLEFGSFGYRFGVHGEHLPSTVRDRERHRLEDDRAAGETHVDGPADLESPPSPAVVPMQRLFDLFDDRRLISDLFALVEDTRIDARVSDEYPGIRRWLRRLQELEVERRHDARGMPLRRAFVENLVRASLGQADTICWPKGLEARLEPAIAALRVVERAGATVQDTAEVAAALYDLAIVIPNLPPQRFPVEWSELDEDAIAKASEPADQELPEGEEVPYRGPDPPEYRGQLKPELVQLLDELADRTAAPEEGPPLTREQVLELLDRSAEIELAEDADDRPGDLEALLANLQSRADDRASVDDEDAAAGADDEEILWFRYDEWNFQADDYRPSWCRVGERSAAEGELDFYTETLLRYHGLVVETRRQFEQMRPESFRRLKRLEDGHEIDLDQAIEFRADKRAGAGPLARFYTRRNKIKRDVAVAFLLDMSGSTSEPILQPPGPSVTPGRSGALQSSPTSTEGAKRIIDIERESTVLVIEALEAIGDSYGIYGFSGHGRENVEFHVIKHLDQPFDDSVRRRIDRIEPNRSTRMAPAIRHTIAKLNDYDAKVKILILVSDGRPQDEEYGRDHSDREYAVHDTKRALLEARRQRITPFLITVDAAGHDYLRHMCDDIGYEVVTDIESLPRRLPNLYRHLAAD
jgi:nitric oxide reductase NorD protein